MRPGPRRTPPCESQQFPEGIGARRKRKREFLAVLRSGFQSSAIADVLDQTSLAQMRANGGVVPAKQPERKRR